MPVTASLKVVDFGSDFIDGLIDSVSVSSSELDGDNKASAFAINSCLGDIISRGSCGGAGSSSFIGYF